MNRMAAGTHRARLRHNYGIKATAFPYRWTSYTPFPIIIETRVSIIICYK